MLVDRSVSYFNHHFDYRSHPLDQPNIHPTSYSLLIGESEFIRNDTGKSARLSDMMLLLKQLTAILIPANFNQVITGQYDAPLLSIKY